MCMVGWVCVCVSVRAYVTLFIYLFAELCFLTIFCLPYYARHMNEATASKLIIDPVKGNLFLTFKFSILGVIVLLE